MVLENQEKLDTSVILINWEESNIIFNLYYSLYPPIGLAYIASTLKNEIKDVSIMDASALGYKKEDVLKKIDEKKPDFVGFSVFTLQVESVLNLCEEIKKLNPNIKTILGGPHVFFEYEEIMKNENVDYCIRGEGEFSTLELIKKLTKDQKILDIPGLVFRRNNKIISNEPKLIKDLDKLPFPARELLPNNKYRTIQCLGGKKHSTSMIVSRGCLYNCSYCASKAIWKQNIRFRSPENVIEEMVELEKKFGIKYIRFNDDLFTFNKEWVTKFCNLYHENNIKIKWVCDSRVECVSPEILKMMKKAGCKVLFYGIEFGNEKILNSVGKYFTKDQVRKAIKWTNEAEIDSYGFFMMGYPGETKETIKETIDFSLSLNLDWVCYYIVTPYPGTALFNYCKENNMLRTTNWSEYHTRASPVIIHDNLSEKELLDLYSYAQKKFHFRPSYFIKRLSKLKLKDVYFASKFLNSFIKSKRKIKNYG